MKRRVFHVLCGGTALPAAVPLAWAQAPLPAPMPGRPWRIGVLTAPQFEAIFERGLRELGYVIGKTVLIESRTPRPDELAAQAAELVNWKPDVLLAATSVRAVAAFKATRAIPIVMVNVSDPVALGLVASLGRPGGNVTGLSRQTFDIIGKTLQLLIELAPRTTRVGLLWNSAEPAGALQLQIAQRHADTLGLKLVPADAHGPDDIDAAFASLARQRVEVLLVNPTTDLFFHRQRIAELALQRGWPSMYSNVEFVQAGGLISYGPDGEEPYLRAAAFVDKIFKGAKPAELPVEQPTRFVLTINAATAKALGLVVPPLLLLRADEVIR